MHIRRVHISDFRGIEQLLWALPKAIEGPGWHVVIGDNGSGKSSVLRAIALALVGPEDAPALRQNWNDWIRFGRPSSKVEVDLSANARVKPRRLGVRLVRHPSPRVVEANETRGTGSTTARLKCFSASYGPFRRFAGGDSEFDKLLLSRSLFAPHLSIFSETVALKSGLVWLRDLKVKEMGLSPVERKVFKLKGMRILLADVTKFVNQPGFLPHGLTLDEVTSEEVFFRDAAKARVKADDLSDGFRSVLSMTFELLRQMFAAQLRVGKPSLFDRAREKVTVSGVVLIDEVDAHLHPTWQREIGPWFCRHFPKVQFIVTTHSPLVCQASEHGSVFHLPAPGSNDRASFVTGIDLGRLVSGDVLEAYGTGAFGLRETRSAQARSRVEELMGLNTKELTAGLTKRELGKRAELRAILPTQANRLTGRTAQRG